MVDKLENMFKQQHQLQLKLGMLQKIKNNKDKQQYINQQILAMMEEVVEVMKESAYKNPQYLKFGWKKNQQMNKEVMKNELIDLQHFILNVALILDMSAQEFYERYLIKREANIARKQNDY